MDDSRDEEFDPTSAERREIGREIVDWYDFEATTMGPGEMVLVTLNIGALSATAIERCANG